MLVACIGWGVGVQAGMNVWLSCIAAQLCEEMVLSCQHCLFYPHQYLWLEYTRVFPGHFVRSGAVPV